MEGNRRSGHERRSAGRQLCVQCGRNLHHGLCQLQNGRQQFLEAERRSGNDRRRNVRERRSGNDRRRNQQNGRRQNYQDASDRYRRSNHVNASERLNAFLNVVRNAQDAGLDAPQGANGNASNTKTSA